MIDVREPVYPDRSMFAYDTSRWLYAEGEALGFDENYRLAQLPLVAPGHPLSVEQTPGADYLNGRYERERLSLVAPIRWETLTSGRAYGGFAEDLAASSVQPKLSGEITERRRDRLHATVAGGLREGDLARTIEVAGRFLEEHGPVRVRVLGPFVGRKNTGRIYLPVIPEMIGGEQAFGLLQARLGLPVSNFYAVGLLNLAEELNPAETRELSGLIGKWQNTVLLETRLPRLEILGTHDDLVLSGRRVAGIPD
jgi:hypothetical protein